jgi:magnesium chelatase family protein
MTSRELREYCPLDTVCRKLLRDCCNELGLSARAHDKILRVGRTIADLDDSDSIQAAHLQEAINFRMLDRNLLA